MNSNLQVNNLMMHLESNTCRFTTLSSFYHFTNALQHLNFNTLQKIPDIDLPIKYIEIEIKNRFRDYQTYNVKDILDNYNLPYRKELEDDLKNKEVIFAKDLHKTLKLFSETGNMIILVSILTQKDIDYGNHNTIDVKFNFGLENLFFIGDRKDVRAFLMDIYEEISLII